jgi:hypothetical protein
VLSPRSSAAAASAPLPQPGRALPAAGLLFFAVAGCALHRLAGSLMSESLFQALALGALAAVRPARVGRAAAVSLVAAGLVAAVAPWTLRNALLHGRLVLVNTSGAYNLWLGNALDASRVEDAPTRAWLLELRAGRSEVEVADELAGLAFGSVVAAPGTAVARWARNGAALWLDTHGALARPFGRLALAPVLMLAAQGFGRPAGRP